MNRRLFEKWSKVVAGKRSSWATILVWIILIAAVSFIWPQVNDRETTDNQLLPEDAMSVEATEIISEEFSNDAGTPLLLVWYRDGGLEMEDYEGIQALYASLDEDPIDYQKSVPPLYEAPPQALTEEASDDEMALTTPLFFEEATADQLEVALEDLSERLEEQFGRDVQGKSLDEDGLHVRYSGAVGIQIDAIGLFENADFTLLIATVLIVFIILIVLYRSPILAMVPLLAVGVAYLFVSPLLGFLADKAFIEIDAQAISIMTVLLFGAGTDYSILLISRYRDELREEENKYLALQRAMGGTGGAILISSLTTLTALLTLLLADYVSFDRFAIPFSISIFVMGVSALTLLPAILAIFGRIAFIPFVPRTEDMTKRLEEKKGKKVRRSKANNRFGNMIGRLVTNRPWTVIVVTLIFLGGLVAFIPQMKFTFALIDSFPEDMESREGFTIISEHYPPGEIAPAQIIVDRDEATIELQEELQNHPQIETVSEAVEGSNNDHLVKWDVTLAIDPYSNEAMELIPELISLTETELETAGISNPENHVWIGGETATLYDTDQVNSSDQATIMPFLLLVIAVLLLVYFRSIVATIYLLGTVILSYLAALGLGWIVLHYGFGVDQIQGFIPLYVFVFSVALGIDYNIFLVSNLWEKRRRMPLKDAIASSVAETGSVISSAGIILAATFSVLAVLPLELLVHFGTIVALGVILDTFIVRPLLVPAITMVLGRFAFWPGKRWKLAREDYEREEARQSE
jgi:RND superfamily putative drug exporter